jgi:hypothetical protein
LEYEEFSQVIQDAWSVECNSRLAIDIWQNKVRSVRQKSKGWSINVDDVNKKKKEDLIQEYDILDVFRESNQLDDGDRLRMSQTRSELDSILKNEEVKA